MLVLATAFGHAATAQLLDATLAETLNDAIDAQVEQQLENEIAGAIEQQVENAVETTVEQQIENAVTDTIAEQVEAGVTETVREQIESGVAGTITQELESTIEQSIEGTLEGVVEHDVGDALQNALQGGLDQVIEDIGGVAQRAAGADGVADNAAAPQAFIAGVDAVGRAVERQIWVILVPGEHADRIASWGFNIRLRRTLPGLDRVLLRVDAPEDRDIAQAALDLALDAPGTSVDFNHVYAPTAEVGEGSQVPSAAVSEETGRAAAPTLTIGMIDSAVATSHAAFDDAEIVQQDFVPFDAQRPLAHGTAVASILVDKDGALRKNTNSPRLHVASVLFADPAGNTIATTESLVAALAWHAAEGINVVNMSLAGPPNRVLETAISAATERGVVVVAAVGNNGPTGEPLYPAAYASVVGVTAVDSAHRIYRYANRGRHVTFAAPGVRIKVADSAGGYSTLSGTSMAAPYAAAIIAQACAAQTPASNSGVLAALKATAIDLGPKDFDDVFGYGLIAPAASSGR